MVKADIERDYYVDLDLPVTCTTEEVKKQFRKLALKYHPDRHPGEELQWIPRFQAISAAHETLSDPDQRRRYDQIRRQSPLGSTAARGPPQPPRAPAAAPRGNPYQAHSDFPPPKMRTQTRPATASFGKGGANRYTDFPRPPPPPRDNTNNTNDARARSNMFNAWQSMNNAQSQQTQSNQHYNQTPPGTDPRRTDGRYTPDNGGTPRPANSSAHRSAWEETNRQPPSQSGYMRPPPPPPPRPQPEAQPQAPTAKRPDPLGTFRRHSRDEAPYTEGNPRVRTPYASNAGEKTYFSSASIPRSASTRDSTKLRDDTGKHPSSDERRHRSSSPGSRKSDAPQYQRPKSGDTPVTAAGGSPQQQRAKPFPMYSSSSSEESDEFFSGSEHAGDPGSHSSSRSRPMANPSTKWAKRGGQGEDVEASAEKDKSEHPIFTIPINEETFTRTSESRRAPSTANINTNFSPTGAPPVFSGTVPSTDSNRTAETPVEPLPSRGRAGPESYDQPVNLGTGNVQSPTSTTSIGDDGKFSADGWAKKLQEDNWAAQWAFPSAAGTVPTRNNSSPRRAKPAGLRASASTKSQEQFHANTNGGEHQGHSVDTTANTEQRRASHDSNAMDLDPEPPSAEERYTQQQSAAHTEPRQTYVQSERPNVPTEAERRPSYPNLPGPPPGPPPTKGRRVSNAINLDDLRQVPPLSGATSGGINSLNDLTTGLPFQSQASTKPPPSTKSSSNKPQIELPKPPKGPSPPQDLTQDQWTSYLDRLTVYHTAWNTFNTNMVFLIQQSAARFAQMAKGSEGGMLDGFFGIVGETSTLGGWETYKLQMKHDERMRTYWTVSWEKHMDVMERHDKLRIKASRNGLPL